jgi:hypothetical protein
MTTLHGHCLYRTDLLTVVDDTGMLIKNPGCVRIDSRMAFLLQPVSTLIKLTVYPLHSLLSSTSNHTTFIHLVRDENIEAQHTSSLKNLLYQHMCIQHAVN